MRTLSGQEVVRIWEAGAHQHPVDQALTMLAVSFPEMSREEMASLTIGERDALLLSLRERLFGPRLDGDATCPGCGTRLQFTFHIGDIRLGPDAGGGEREMRVSTGGHELLFRLPHSRDLAAIAGTGSVEEARDVLVRRCVLKARHGGEEVQPEELPETIVTGLAEEMAARDPQAEVRLDLSCLECGHSWDLLFDILTFLWAEISACAKKLMLDVHILARNYGWSEADILSMSASKRQCYLDLAT